ncbi:hypothetical protein JXA27_05725 [Aerococcaceae bacterium zg-B36]|uniref:hypothetical protein n=1 Tax=Aerococcaceae bacterium zg-252 TaxID=2796928 RepID=UPI001BD8A178|nr:hypothetical protein [Aerococcaceae bacterium zg-B36]
MKNWKKKLVALTATTLLAGGPALSTVSAQEKYDQAFFTELTKANQGYSALKFDGTIKVSALSDGQSADLGVLAYDGQFNAEPLSAAFNVKLSSLFLGEDKFNLSAYLKDNIAYIHTPASESEGMTWSAIDLASQIGEFKQQFEAQMAQFNADAEQSAEVSAKFTDVNETDSEYVLSLKKDITADELWEAISTSVDFEKIMNDAIAQAEAQTGETLSAEERAQVESIYSKESLEKFLKWNPIIEAHYDKETKLMKSMHLSITINTEDIVTPTEENEETESTLPSIINVVIDMNFSEHGVEQAIDVPEDALATEVQPLETAE